MCAICRRDAPNRFDARVALLDFLGALLPGDAAAAGGAGETQLIADFSANADARPRPRRGPDADASALPPESLRVFAAAAAGVHERRSRPLRRAATRRLAARRRSLPRIAIVALIALLHRSSSRCRSASLLSKSFESADGDFVGLANYVRYFSTPALVASLWNSLWIAAL